MCCIRTILIVFCIFGISSKSFAIQLAANVDRTEARVGNQLTLTITLEGAQQTSTPNLPPLDDFEVYSAGTSSNMQIINGQTSVSINYRYVLVAKQAGIFTIGKASVTLGSKTYTTKPFQVKILPADAVQPQPTKPSDHNDTFIITTLSEQDPHVYEGVVYTFRFYRRINLQDARLELPEFNGFLVENLGEQSSYDTTIKGTRYLVTEIKKILFPQQAGQLTIQPARLHCKVPVRDKRRRGQRPPVDDFFDSPFNGFFGNYKLEPRVLSSKPNKLQVRELPEKPKNFSGLVGKFTLAGKLSKDRLQLGESTTLTLTVRGTGNVQSIPEPIMSDLEHFKIYPDKPVGKKMPTSKSLSGFRTFKKALVPLKVGSVQIPGAQLVFFDPEFEKYETAQTPPFQLEVLPASGKEELKLTEIISPSTGKVSVKLLGEDLIPIHPGLDGLNNHAVGLIARAFGLCGLVLPAMLYIGIVLVRRRRERLESDLALLRRREASTKARTQLKKLKSFIHKGQNREAVETASRLLREYLGDMLNTGGGAMTSLEATEHLKRIGICKPVTDEVRDLLQKLESSLYAANQPEDSDFTNLDRRIQLLLAKISKEIRKTVAQK